MYLYYFYKNNLIIANINFYIWIAGFGVPYKEDTQFGQALSSCDLHGEEVRVGRQRD